MKGKIRVRNFLPSDMEKILDYREETARISYPLMKVDRNKAKKTLLEHAKKHPGTIKVAESRGKPIGYIRFRPKTGSLGEYGYVNIIFVEKSHRKHGLGALLLKEAEKWLGSKGIRRIEAAVTRTNAHSLDFFRNQGYREKRTVLEKKI